MTSAPPASDPISTRRVALATLIGTSITALLSPDPYGASLRRREPVPA